MHKHAVLMLPTILSLCCIIMGGFLQPPSTPLWNCDKNTISQDSDLYAESPEILFLHSIFLLSVAPFRSPQINLL